MSRFERKTYQIGVIVAAVLIVAMVAVKTEGCGRIDVYAAQECAIDYFSDGAAKVPEMGQIREDSGMPCVNPEQFEAWYETYSESEPEPQPTQPVLYRIAGEVVDPGLQERLFHHLEAAGISYWFEGALAQMYQESHCQQYAQNPNGLDKGIFQYRSTYWDWSSGDIFDIDAQMRRYAAEMAARFNAGLSTDEAISRHNTSDFVTAVNWEYVAQVKQWIPTMEAIR